MRLVCESLMAEQGIQKQVVNPAINQSHLSPEVSQGRLCSNGILPTVQASWMWLRPGPGKISPLLSRSDLTTS